MTTTYGNDIMYCLKSHCGVRGYCRQKCSNLIIYYSPFRFANITLCVDMCKRINEKAANDCSFAAVW